MGFPKGIQKIIGVGATITNPNGPTTTITVAAGLPAWFQSGAGSPVGNVVPAVSGASLYFDTTATSGGLWSAFGATNTKWVMVAANGTEAGGLFTTTSGDVELVSLDANLNVLARSAQGGVNEAMEVGSSSSNFLLFVYAGSPVGVLTSLEKGDLCVDTSTPAVWQATASAATTWANITPTVPIYDIVGIMGGYP